jgi:hypothetical protein
MKLHFVGSVEGNKEDYKKIIETAKDLGWEVLTEHSLERSMEDIKEESEEEAELYAKKMLQWIKKADVVLVEATKAALGSGFELATALNLSKPVIVFYQPEDGERPHVLKGISSDRLQVVSYNNETLKEALKFALDYAAETQDTRFNFFISPKHQNYLDWIAKHQKIPRSVFLRHLIEEHMVENKEYAGVAQLP